MKFFNPYTDSLDGYISRSLKKCVKYRLTVEEESCRINFFQMYQSIVVLGGRG